MLRDKAAQRRCQRKRWQLESGVSILGTGKLAFRYLEPDGVSKPTNFGRSRTQLPTSGMADVRKAPSDFAMKKGS